MEKAISSPKHLEANYIPKTNQSGFHPKLRTEIPLMHVWDDILELARNDCVLIFLDLSAAFNMLDHIILLHCLKPGAFITEHLFLQIFSLNIFT